MTTPITFTYDNTEGMWKGTFSVENDFNLHIENGGRILVFQRTSGILYAPVDLGLFAEINHKNVIDYDFASVVYPKDIKVLCEKEPSNSGYTLRED